jgi:hypothetical protein
MYRWLFRSNETIAAGEGPIAPSYEFELTQALDEQEQTGFTHTLTSFDAEHESL